METEIEQMNSQYEIIQAQYKMANVLNSDKLENKEKYLKQLLQDQIDRNKRYVVIFNHHWSSQHWIMNLIITSLNFLISISSNYPWN